MSRAPIYAGLTLAGLVAGYLWGYGVGEREGLDSDPGDDVESLPAARPLVVPASWPNYG